MNKVISRRRVHVPGGEYSGKPVLAGSIVRTAAGYDAVLIVEGLDPVAGGGHATAEDAYKRLFEMLDFAVPDFLAGGWKPGSKKRKSRAKAKVTETSDGVGSRGSTHYVITGETEGQIRYAVRQIMQTYAPAGYGTSFGDLETINGQLMLRGSRRNNCD